LLNIYLRVDTSKPKHPGEVPDFIANNAVLNSSTVISIPKSSESLYDKIPVKSHQKSLGSYYG
jgi:hypothetical protein